MIIIFSFKISIFLCICIGLIGCNNQITQDHLPQQSNNEDIANQSANTAYVAKEKINAQIKEELSNNTDYISYRENTLNSYKHNLQNYPTKDEISELIEKEYQKARNSHKKTIEDALKDYLPTKEIKKELETNKKNLETIIDEAIQECQKNNIEKECQNLEKIFEENKKEILVCFADIYSIKRILQNNGELSSLKKKKEYRNKVS